MLVSKDMERSVFSQRLLGSAMALLLVTTVNRAWAGEIAAYWGQSDTEGSLVSLYNTGNYNIILISFLYQFGRGQSSSLNLEGHCDPPSGGCKRYASQIRTCQSKGIKVLLSLGGADGNYGFNAPDEARALAQQIWNSYMGGNGRDRPLGDAQLDGIDLDIEHGGSQYYADLGRGLRELAQNNAYKKVYLSLAPQFPFPDKSLGPASSKFLFSKLADYIFVQFYNNQDCDIRGRENAVVSAWRQWTSSLPDPKPKVFFGLPASQAAGDGYMSPNTLKNNILPRIKSIGNYGGVMLWDPTSGNGNYAANIRSSV
ncbi:hypothetical protein R1flu_003675 [Riccia fluitans]|uniref:chitinase n=1 Tax=Riccia fluitans TaxID=41844 RepID=A0ABD1Y9T5_9MARC